MSNVSNSPTNAMALQAFNAKVAEVVARKRQLEKAGEKNPLESKLIGQAAREELRAARLAQLRAKTNETARLEQLKAARNANQLAAFKNNQSVSRKLLISDNASYRQTLALEAKNNSQRVVDKLDIQETESNYYAKLATDLVNQQIFALKLGDKRLNAKLEDMKLQDNKLLTDNLEAENLQATLLEDTLLEKTEEFDKALDPDPSQTPSLLTRRRMEKLVEVIEGKSANAEGVSLEI